MGRRPYNYAESLNLVALGHEEVSTHAGSSLRQLHGRSAPMERKNMAVIDYRTRDGLADYGFSIEFQPGKGWRVYIIFQPFNHGHDDNLDLPYQ
jgi:hypothetical protein